MTAATKAAAEASGYAVTQYKRNGKFVCWLTKIGYHKNDAGTRVRSWQYHGKDFPNAQRAALDLGKQWESILAERKKKKDYAEHWIRAELYNSRINGYYLDENDNKVEFSGTRSEVEKYRQKLILQSSYPPPAVWPHTDGKKPSSGDQRIIFADTPKAENIGVSISDARDKYIAAYKFRVGLIGQSGIKPDTAFSHSRDLKLALKAFDVSSPVSSITRESLKQIITYWRAPDREIKERSSNNYLRAIKQFLDALEDMNVGYSAPKISDLFQFRKVKGEIVKYDKAKARALLNVLDDRFRLYQLLALNCGFTQVDICNLKRDEIVKIKEDTFIVRKRDKSSHQNDFTSQWWLFPETAALLKSQIAKKNDGGFALLRPNGKPLKLRAGNDNHVNEQYQRAREAEPQAVDSFSFKQWRKIGVTAVKRITSSSEIARKYAAQRIQGALDNYDRDDFFDDLTKAMKKWHKELKADKVFAKAGD